MLTPHSSRLAPHAFFVTGTDTGIGKTFVACALLRAAVARGLKAVGMKPVAAGAERVSGGWVNEDAQALRAAGNVDAPAEDTNPYCFEPPIAPHVAAREAGVEIEVETIRRAYHRLAARSDLVVVEGAGGYLVPLSAAADMSHLPAALGVSVIMVVGMRLGCINHARLTAQAIEASGAMLAGWVANHVDPEMAHAPASVEAIASRVRAPLLGRVPFGADADTAARALDLGMLLAP